MQLCALKQMTQPSHWYTPELRRTDADWYSLKTIPLKGMIFQNIYMVRWTCQYANKASPYLQHSLKLCSLSHPLRNENFYTSS